MTDGPTRSERSPADSRDGDWEALASGLGRLLGSLADVDVVTFAIDDVVVLSVSRDGRDVWLLAIGAGDQVEPIELSADLEATLAFIGFQAPMGEKAERSPQRDNWWFHLRVPADPLLLESAGHLLVAVARQVYGAGRPSAIVWFGMALSEETRHVLDSLGVTRSEFQD